MLKVHAKADRSMDGWLWAWPQFACYGIMMILSAVITPLGICFGAFWRNDLLLVLDFGLAEREKSSVHIVHGGHVKSGPLLSI